MKGKKEIKGIWIPLNIWLISELSLIERVFLSQIQSLDNTNRGCYASNAYFSDLFDITNGRASQIITSLKDKKFIKISLKYEGKQVKERNIKVVNKLSTLYRKLKGVFSKLNEGIYKTKGGYLENAQVNSIDTNSILLNNTIKQLNIELSKKEKIIEDKNLLILELEKKLLKPKKKKEVLHGPCKEMFLEYYSENKKSEYYWVVKDATALNQIIKKIRSLDKDLSNDSVMAGFEKLITSVKIYDSWIYENLSPSLLNSKFNELIEKIKADRKEVKKTGQQSQNYDWLKERLAKNIKDLENA